MLFQPHDSITKDPKWILVMNLVRSQCNQDSTASEDIILKVSMTDKNDILFLLVLLRKCNWINHCDILIMSLEILWVSLVHVSQLL